MRFYLDFRFSNVLGMKWHLVLLCISLITNENEHFFISLLSILVSFVNCLDKYFVHFFLIICPFLSDSISFSHMSISLCNVYIIFMIYIHTH